MKKIIIKVVMLTFVSLAFVQFSNAQLKVKKLSSTKENNVVNYSIEVSETENYSVTVLFGAKSIAKPIINKSFTKGELLNFKVNTKHWRPGSYKILIENGKNVITTRTIRIAPEGF